MMSLPKGLCVAAEMEDLTAVVCHTPGCGECARTMTS